jgi:hypothetical protein
MLLARNGCKTVLIETHVMDAGDSTSESVSIEMAKLGFTFSNQKDTEGFQWIIAHFFM